MSTAITPLAQLAADEVAGLDSPEIERRMAALKLKMALMEAEELEERLADRHAAKARARQQAQKQQLALEESQAMTKMEQAVCKHKKGGKNLQGILNGNDSNYSVNQHTYPWGETRVSCTRCGREWAPPTEALRLADPAAFREQLRAYREALNWPTDNEPSAAEQFQIIRRTAQGDVPVNIV